jgi:uncharacterized protein YbcI
MITINSSMTDNYIVTRLGKIVTRCLRALKKFNQTTTAQRRKRKNIIISMRRNLKNCNKSMIKKRIIRFRLKSSFPKGFKTKFRRNKKRENKLSKKKRKKSC